MGLFSLILLLVPFIIGGIALLLERVETHLDTPEKKADSVSSATADTAVSAAPDANVEGKETPSNPQEQPSD